MRLTCKSCLSYYKCLFAADAGEASSFREVVVQKRQAVSEKTLALFVSGYIERLGAPTPPSDDPALSLLAFVLFN